MSKGKRKGKGQEPKKELLNAASSDEEENALEAILDDEIDRYNASRDQELLPKGKSKSNKFSSNASDEEVFGLDLEVSEDEEEGGFEEKSNDDDLSALDGEDSDDDLDDNDDDDDDDEDIYGDERKDGIPDEKAWGKRAKVFHSTDYVDQDFGGMQGEDEEQAELEEQEALAIQKRLTAELEDDDFVDFLPVASSKPKQIKYSEEIETLKIDVSKMTESEIKKLVDRHCPELDFLLKDCAEKLSEANRLQELVTESNDRPALRQFYSTRYHVLSNYCINVTFFLHLRAVNPKEATGHPVVKKIMQYRRLIDELDQMDVKRFESAPAAISFVEPVIAEKKKTKRNIDVQEDVNHSEDEVDQEGEAGKRKITYEMQKNKGLMPKRSKEQRNPRVKYREKFRKAKIRRKGQAPTMRTEKTAYDGEMFGIKANISKSVKFK